MSNNNRVESVILEGVIGDEDYARKVLPFIETEYFSERIDNLLFTEVKRFFGQHNKIPTKKILKLFLDDNKTIKQEEYDIAIELIDSLGDPEPNKEWLVQRTEKFCSDRAIYLAIMKTIAIYDGKNTTHSREAIPTLLSDALNVSFDKSVGHDYFLDADSRYDFYHLKEDRLPFDLDMFNKITKGGLPKKTLSVMLASTGVGKSLFMCHHAANVLRNGKNVLYITMEMAEQRIAERIDCNMLGVSLSDLERMNRKDYRSKIDDIQTKTHGKLIVKEYPTSGAHVGHFKALLDELKMKKDFTPDIIFIDYINICASQRYPNAGSFNSYTIIKAIAEELRGMAVEYDVPVFSATQTTRSGIGNTDIELTDTSESIGLPATVDFMFAGIRTEELDALGQFMVKQLKSRFNDINYYKRFVVGVDLAKFKLYDVDNPIADLIDTGKTDKDVPVFDNSKFGIGMKAAGDFKELDFS